MRNKLKRFLALLLAVAMVLPCVPAEVFAAESEPVALFNGKEYDDFDEVIAEALEWSSPDLVARVDLLASDTGVELSTVHQQTP